MKVIDLLNLIASGEQPPHKIKFYNKEFIYVGIDYINRDYDEELLEFEHIHLMDRVGLNQKYLNEEVEVIEYE